MSDEEASPRTPARVKRLRAEARRARRARRRPLLRAAHGLVRRLPLPVAAALGHVLGRLVWYFHRPFRERVLAHLDVAFGDDLRPRVLRRHGRRSLGRAGAGLLSYQVLHRMGTERALGRLEVVGAEHLEGALAGGRGCLIVSFHFGLFELAASWAGSRFGAVAVGRPTRGLERVEQHTRMRAELGCETVQRGNPRGLLRALRAGRPVVMLSDHDVRRVNGVFVPFFGRLAHTPAGPAALAIRSGVPMVPAFTFWTGLTRHRLEFSEPLWPRQDLSGDEQLLELTHRYTRFGEERVRAHPDHWIWLHKRWETRPEERPDLPVLDDPESAASGSSGRVGVGG